MPFVVRNCLPSEIPKVINLLKDADLYIDAIDNKDALEKKLSHYPADILVLLRVSDDRIMGAVFIVHDPWVSFVFHLVVDVEVRGRGYGELLLRKAEDELRQRGASAIVGYIDYANTPSRRLLGKLGYVEYPNPVVCVGKVLDKSRKPPW